MRRCICLLALTWFGCSSPNASSHSSAGATSGGAGGRGSGGSGGAGTQTGGTTSGGGGNTGGSHTGGSSSGGTGGNGASGAPGAAGAAGAAGSDYKPCPSAGTPCKVMPLGDSITVGAGGGWTGYRIPLFRLAVAAGQLMTYVGSQIDGPDSDQGVPFPKNHEGHGGYTISTGGGRAGIQEIIVARLTTYQPDIIIMMIGTNDINIHLADAPGRLGTLMDTITDTSPKALLVAAKIVPSTDDAENRDVEAYNATFDGMVATRVANGKHIITVDMYAAFTKDANFKTDYMFDLLHPNNAGYEVMSGVWYAALGPLLPK